MEIDIKGYKVLIDDEDFEKVSMYKWHEDGKRGGPYFHAYLCRVDGKQTTISLHRLLMNNPMGKYVDHINGDTADNRKCNLRVCTNSENIRNQKKRKDNKSGYKGVFWSKNAKKWTSQICNNNKSTHLGYFATPEEAHAAYCEASKKYHGEFGRIA